MDCIEARLGCALVIAVEVVTAEATRPFLLRDQFTMRDIERIALKLEFLVARCAGRGNHGDPQAFVLAMAGHAGLCAETGARLEKSRLKESMHWVRILIAGVTTGALLVTDTAVAKCGIGGAQPQPKLNFGLELLAQGSGCILVAIAAGKRIMSRIGRAFGMETRMRYYRYGRDCRQDDDRTQQIGDALDRPLDWKNGSWL